MQSDINICNGIFVYFTIFLAQLLDKISVALSSNISKKFGGSKIFLKNLLCYWLSNIVSNAPNDKILLEHETDCYDHGINNTGKRLKFYLWRFEHFNRMRSWGSYQCIVEQAIHFTEWSWTTIAHSFTPIRYIRRHKHSECNAVPRTCQGAKNAKPLFDYFFLHDLMELCDVHMIVCKARNHLEFGGI